MLSPPIIGPTPIIFRGAFAAELAGKLEASEKRNRELQWQVSMLAAPKELEAGPAGEPPRGPANWLAGAIKGCVAPRPGRARIG